MRKTNSLFLMGLSVLALGACTSSDKGNWGSVDDITVNNRGVAPAKKIIPSEDKLAEVKKEVNQIIDAKAKAPVTEIKTKSMDATVQAVEARVETAVSDVVELAHQPMETTTMIQPPELRAQKPLAPTNMSGDLPPNAKPGECYAKVLIPAKVQGREETVQISEEQKVLARIIPAQYEIETKS